MGQSPLRRSWEEIVMKSSEHWSVVAASARHWQDLARRKKGNEGEATTVRKKSSVHSITEDMVSFNQLKTIVTWCEGVISGKLAKDEVEMYHNF